MADRPTYSLQILLGTIAEFAVAAGAFAAPESLASGFLVLILATCGPGLLVIVWRSGGGYRRSFAIGAAAPCVVCAYRSLRRLSYASWRGPPTMSQTVDFAGSLYRWQALTILAVGLGGGLMGIALHWLFKARDEKLQKMNQAEGRCSTEGASFDSPG